MQYRSIKGLVSLIVLLFSNGTIGLPGDRDQPIQLEADWAQLDQQTGTSTFRGKVIISQGSMRLTADIATVYTDDGQLQRMEAQGNPATLRYRPTPDQEEVHGESQRVDYNAITAQVTMTTDAKVTQGQDIFIGERIEYDLANNLIKADSPQKGGRIRFTIQPKAETQSQ